MGGPIVFVSYHRIKDGQLGPLRKQFQTGGQALKNRNPATALFDGYADEAGGEVSFVHVFPDGQAMKDHLQGADERSQRALEFIEPLRFEIFGDPGDDVMGAMRKAAGENIELHWKPQAFGGFARLRAAD